MSGIIVQAITGAMARISVTVDSGTLGDMRLWCVLPSGQRRIVVGTNPTPAASGSWDDPEAPIGQPVTYLAQIGASTWIGPSAPVTIAADRPIVSDPTRGVLCQVIVLRTGTDRAYSSRATAIDISGRTSRVHVWDVEGPAVVSPQWLTTTDTDRAALRDLMSTGNPFLVRYPCLDLADEWLMRAGDRTEAAFSSKPGGAIRHTISSCDVLDGPPDPDTPVFGDTLGDLHAAVGGDGVGTLGVIATTWATLGAIAATDLKALS